MPVIVTIRWSGDRWQAWANGNLCGAIQKGPQPGEFTAFLYGDEGLHHHCSSLSIAKNEMVDMIREAFVTPRRPA